MQGESDEKSFTNTRAKFADVVHAASTRGGITYITSRERRVAAVVPFELAEAAEAVGGPNEAARILKRERDSSR